MPSRLVKPRRYPPTSPNPEFAIHQDFQFVTDKELPPTPTLPVKDLNGAVPTRTLSPASRGVINSMMPTGAATTATARKQTPESPYFGSPTVSSAPRMISTIRTVPSFEGVVSDTSSDTPSIATKNSAFSSSVNSNVSGISMASQQDEKTVTVRLKDGPSQLLSPRSWVGDQNGDVTRHPTDVASESDWPLRTPQTATTTDFAAEEESHAESQASQTWDSTIGKAGLGKTGRVINKLVSDNETLRRDLKIERLRAEESKQAAKLTEDKMERLISDYESRLLEANVTKALLSRKERQVESLTATVEMERKKAVEALERERIWREEMEKMRHDSKVKVEEASTYAQMMEGRYNAISSHWKDQGDEVKRVVTKLKGEMALLVEERRKDDERIATLRELCDQQDGNIRELISQKERVTGQFEAYKQEQEDQLKDIRTNAHAREAEQERLLEETREVLAKLRWALNVKENVRDAQ